MAAVSSAVRALEAELQAYLGRSLASAEALAGRAQAEWASGRSAEAAVLAELALKRGPAVSIRSDLQLLLARNDTLHGRQSTACERLRTEAAALAGTSPVHAAILLCEASRAAFAAGDARRALETALEADRLARRAPAGIRRNTRLAVAIARVHEGADRAETLIEQTLDSIDAAPPDQFGAIHRWSVALLWAERHDEARAVLERVIRGARDLQLQDLLPIALDTLAAVEFRIGRWPAAAAHSNEALRLARAHNTPFDMASSLTTLARLEAAQGVPEAMDHVREAELIHPAGGLILGYAASAAALFELTVGRPDRAALQLERIASSAAATFEPTVFRWEADHVESLLRAERTADARAALARFGRRAGTSRRAWTRAVLHRCRGLLAPVDSFDVEFGEALRWHRGSPMPFERARTELCYGERLRRARRQTEAQTWFRSALATFEQLGATPWALRARRGVAGKGRRFRDDVADSTLTAHERQVAALVQRGATNREAAAALFVTPKTIEYHLASIYRKLGVRSRTELAYVLADDRGRR